ncbi:MAG: queuosine precursor transporter [Bacilli bacterium]|nr:queuosine precursor transporter [Bacilli bacterium]MBN2877513.1 queuosine precursor transporter [Bacilli bacterium]
MPNELIWVLFALVNFILFMVMFKLFGKLGIFIWIGMSTILANIQVTEFVTLFGLNATLGNIMYGTIFLGTDALNEIYGKKQAKKAVFMGFTVMVFTLIIMTIALQFNPSADDTGFGALQSIFGVKFPMVVVGSFTAFIISQMIDVNLFQWIRKKLPETKYLWIRNNGSTIVSQLFDTVIFVTIAFVWDTPWNVMLEIMVSTYVIKVMVAALDTPFIYLAKKIKPLEDD